MMMIVVVSKVYFLSMTQNKCNGLKKNREFHFQKFSHLFVVVVVVVVVVVKT